MLPVVWNKRAGCEARCWGLTLGSDGVAFVMFPAAEAGGSHACSLQDAGGAFSLQIQICVFLDACRVSCSLRVALFKEAADQERCVSGVMQMVKYFTP